MPLNRKSRVSTRKKVFNKTLFKLHQNGVISKQTLLDNDDFPSGTIILTDGEQIIKNNSATGCTCMKCGQINEYAEPNQSDGTFLCFTCKNGY
jgi:hypothetical protein